MNYQKIYNSIIEKARLESRKKTSETYYESHHIIPLCLKGMDSKENKILLTAKEHFLCHKLLIKMYPSSNGIKLAFFRMCHKSYNQQRKNLSLRDYEYGKEMNREE